MSKQIAMHQHPLYREVMDTMKEQCKHLRRLSMGATIKERVRDTRLVYSQLHESKMNTLLVVLSEISRLGVDNVKPYHLKMLQLVDSISTSTISVGGKEYSEDKLRKAIKSGLVTGAEEVRLYLDAELWSDVMETVVILDDY